MTRGSLLVSALASAALVACGSSRITPEPGPEDAAPAPTSTVVVPSPSATLDAAPPPADATPEGDGGVATGQLSVLSLNLHCLKTEGTVFPNNAARFAAIATLVASEDVDVVLAQEVCVSTTENARTLMLSSLSAATGATWSATLAFTHRAWEGTPDESDENVAIFSRQPLADPKELVHGAQGSLRRVTLGASTPTRLKTASGAPLTVRVYTVHLDHETPLVRAKQAREVASAAMVDSDALRVGLDMGARAVSLPVIVAGDFNSRRSDPPPQSLADFGFVESSESAKTTRIDHVFAHRSAPLVVARAKEVFLGAAAVSDHPGVVVRFAASPAKPVRLTRVLANGSFPSPLSLRGDRAPLSWDLGWPVFAGATGSNVALVTSELPPSPFAYKFLRQDVDWATGNNVAGAGETDNASTPTFP